MLRYCICKINADITKVLLIFAKKIKMIDFDSYDFSMDELTNRVDAITSNKTDKASDKEILKQILNFIDLTTLSGDDTSQHVTNLCNKAVSFADKMAGIKNVAAVCVYPVFAKLVKSQLSKTNIKTACVAGAFPSGQSPLSVRLNEVEFAVSSGADEIDMVISRGKLLEGDNDYVSNEVGKIKVACGEAHLKVILETGELKTVQNIRKASELSILAGADFIKTSTGKIQPAATPEAFLIMLDTIKEYYETSGKMIGIKPAGGISNISDALTYYLLVERILGNSWLCKDHFRIGASSLADNVYNAIII
jgi:deoxyribose-phosphate aldolase